MRLTDIALDVESEGGIPRRGGAGGGALSEGRVAENAVVDLKPFIANARKSIDTAIADFRRAVTACASMPRSPICGSPKSPSMRRPCA